MPSKHHIDDLRELAAEDLRAYCQGFPEYVHEIDDFDESPLMAACGLGRTDLVQVLLESGAKVNFVAGDGESPLKSAVYSSRENLNRELFDLLIAAGVEPNRGNEPALHVAVGQGNRDVVRYLVEHGADPNLRDIDGAPPIFWARANSKRPDVVMMGLLVSLGADLSLCDGVGQTVEQRFGREVIAEVLRHSVD